MCLFLSSFISQAGQYYNDLTEEERLICSQTALFEDFVVEFLDKCFAFIESSTLEQTREEVSLSDHKSSREEKMKDVGMASTFNVMLIHSNEAFYDVALKKVQKNTRVTFNIENHKITTSYQNLRIF